MSQVLHKYLLLLISIVLSYADVTQAAPAKNAMSNKDVVSIQEAWVRPTNPGQDVGSAYMTLTSAKDVALVKVESDAADSVEIHSMTMQNGVMKMRMLDTLPLAAGKPYKLEPGGFHLMLFDLKKPLTTGEQVNFVLHFETKNAPNKKLGEFKQNIKAIVKPEADEATDSHHHH